MPALYKVRSFECIGCGKSVTARRDANKTKFCSQNCYRTSLKPERMTGEYRNCEQCGKPVYVRKNRTSKRVFCDNECWQKYEPEQIRHVCEVCGNEFFWTKCRKGARYCSVTCRDACPDFTNKAIERLNKFLKSKTPTKLEIAGRELMTELGFPFTEQVLMFGKFTVDVLIDGLPLVIQWDGEYWHGYGGAVDDRVKRRVAYDKSQDAYMRKSGFTVLRFWEREVFNERNRVGEVIARAIRKAAD